MGATKGIRVNSIQGLRFWAISLIVASHCGFLRQGGVGNCIFFALSGFLAANPFSIDSELQFLSCKKFAFYYAKRFFRIIPVYWATLLISHFCFNVFDLNDFSSASSLLLNACFIKCWGPLWFIQQEILFYIVLPILMLVFALIKTVFKKFKFNEEGMHLILVVVICILAFLSNRYLTEDVFYVIGNGGPQRFRLCFFLIGMAFSYLLKSLKSHKIPFLFSRCARTFSSVIIFAFLLFTILSAEPILSHFDDRYSNHFVGWEYSIQIISVVGCILLLLLIHNDSIASRFLSIPLFNNIGNISFIVYLVHPYLLSYFEMDNSFHRFIVVYFISIAIASIIYRYIEKPIVNWSNSKFR